MPKGKKEGPNKMDAVRQIIKTHGKETKPLEIVKFAKSEHGFTMSPDMASTYKSTALKQLGLGGMRKGKRGRKPGPKPASETAVAKTSPRTGARISIEDIEAVKKLCDRLGASKVKDLASVVAR
jgi:hypothetical protein